VIATLARLGWLLPCECAARTTNLVIHGLLHAPYFIFLRCAGRYPRLEGCTGVPGG
jgi:hypothetical protein